MGAVDERVVKNAHLPVLVAQTPDARPSQPHNKAREETI